VEESIDETCKRGSLFSIVLFPLMNGGSESGGNGDPDVKQSKADLRTECVSLFEVSAVRRYKGNKQANSRRRTLNK